MQGKDERQRAQEANFARSEEDKFVKAARAMKQLGVWAGGKLGLSQDEANAFGDELRSRSISERQAGVLDYVVARLSGTVSEDEVRRKFADLSA